VAAKKSDKSGRKLNAKAIWLVLANAIFVFLILVGLIIAASLLPIKNNFKIYAVMSGSMESTISTGSAVIVKPQLMYQKGDVITFLPINAKSKKESITHRIESVIDENGLIYFRTKGDANENVDEQPIPSDRVIGKVLFSIAIIGYVVGYIKTLPGLVLIIIIPATIIIYEEVKKLKSEAKKIIEKRKAKGEGKKSLRKIKTK